MFIDDIITFFKDKFKKLTIKKQKENKYYRLKYIFKYRDVKSDYKSQTTSIFKPFKLPENMSYEEALKVISFLTDKVASELKVKHQSLDNIKLTNAVLEKYHFKRAENPVHINNVEDIIIENVRNLAITPNSNKWYKAYIEAKDIKKIYDKLGLEVDFSKFDKKIKEEARSAESQFITIDGGSGLDDIM